MSFVSNQIIPNFTFADSCHALRQIFNIFSKKTIDFPAYFGTKNYILTNSARTAISVIIETVEVPKDKKIGIPAFICAVVATPFLENGYGVEWIDTDDRGLISVEDFKKKSSKIGLVIVPHIFGQKAPIQEIFELARAQNIFVVEDGAHFFEIGNIEKFSKESYFDAKILSFGREKVVSCISGGALIWPEKSYFQEKFIKNLQALPFPRFWWIFRHLCQPFIFSVSLVWWNAGGKIIPWFFRKIKFLPLAVTFDEKQGREDFPRTKMPYAMQAVLLRQFGKYLERKIHARMLTEKWTKVLNLLFPRSEIIIPENFFRVILQVNETEKLKLSQISALKKSSFNLREWDGCPISPMGVDLKKFGYTKGQCPIAEKFSQNYITFPTNIRTGVDAPKEWAMEQLTIGSTDHLNNACPPAEEVN